MPLVDAVLAAGIYVWAGRRQRAEAGGSWRDLLLASLGLGVLTAVPAALALVLYRLDLISRHPASELWIWGAVGTGLVMLYTCRILGRPRSLGRESLPLLEDAAVSARVAELAGRLGLTPPVARVLNSLQGAQATLAFAGGLATPSIVLGDGVLHRLPPEERDGIIAHELGHIAQRSLWQRAALPPLAASLAVVLLLWTRPTLAVVAGEAIFMLLSRFTTRRDEVACDLLAASAVGYATMSRALHKIHAAYVRARLALAREDPQAREAVEAALASARANPLSFLEEQARELGQASRPSE